MGLNMLSALKFVQGAVAKKDFVPVLQHFRLKDGKIFGYNGSLALCSPIGTPLEATPKALPFLKAVEVCQSEAVSLTLTTSKKLVIRSGKFKATIDCEAAGEFPDIFPEGEEILLPFDILPILKKLLPFIADDASRPWARGILFRGSSVFATNNIVVVEHWVGTPFPVEVNVPRSAIVELLRIGEPPVAIRTTEDSISFLYTDGRWLRTQVYSLEWPNLSKILDRDSTAVLIPDGFFKAVETLAPFVDEQGRLFLTEGHISTTETEENGTSVALDLNLAPCCFNVKHLQLLEGIVHKIDFSQYPSPCLFTGDNLRGAIAGVRY